MSAPSRVDQRMRAWALARDCAALGARTRTIHHLTGIPPNELLRLLFTAPMQPPRGRPPDTREWYHNANVLYRAEASLIVANFRRLLRRGFASTEALITAYRHYQSLYRAPHRISFDRAFDLAAHTEGLWIARAASFDVTQCTRCGSEFLDAVGTDPGTVGSCPFCRLLEGHVRDPRLTAGHKGAGAKARGRTKARAKPMQDRGAPDAEIPPTTGEFPRAKSQ